MAITDLGTLKTAVNNWGDFAGTLDDVMNDMVQLTTHMLNYGGETVSPLRVRQMETVVDLTPVDGVCTLPTDYLQYRRVVDPSGFRKPLEYVTPFSSDDIYYDRAYGLPMKFTIIGSSLYMFPLASSNVELTYYAKIPELVDDTDTNWVIANHPGIYLHGTLFQAAMFRRDADLQSRSAGMLGSLLSGLTGADEMANYAYAFSIPRGITIA